MSRHKPLAPHEIERLSEDRLLEHMCAAREAGDEAGRRRALAVLAWGFEDAIVKRIALKVAPGDVEDVAQKVMLSALTSHFDGSSIGELGSWLHTIADRRIADHYRAARPDEPSLFDDHSDDGALAQAASNPSESGAVEARIVLDEVLARHPRPRRMVIELHVLERVPAGETAERVTRACAGELSRPMTEANVQKIAQRFRDDFRTALAAEPERSPR